ncbi:MAG: chromosomal replication initiator protein DnaA [Butyricicoccus sp.]|nr:chromosomal replication initiator protein DnaA [Butyricicoccus pullicaecorum]MCI6720618.1 chromosomal replication initiator protein DnaA [Clostridiales bacterium]MDY5972453.1 chromosomal replication initiator protein DnaA [Butyricicoccus sp.]
MNSYNDLFQMALSQMKGNLPETSINAWFGDAEAEAMEGNRLVLRAASKFKKEIIENNFKSRLEDALSDLLGQHIEVEVIDGEQKAKPVQAGESIGLSPDEEYTFEHFIVGSSNKFAHAAAISVANHPAENYNPLFIYGQSGLGKTHLLHAIGNVIRGTHPDFRIIYVKGEDFTNELVTAIQEGDVAAFRNKYRMTDLLLIDDIQFIAGKERTQEEFFHTFNALYEAGRQIVLTSDRPPKEMNTLEDRMKTRFEWGLLADIQPPDFETRVAIINAKAEKLGFALPKDVIYCIAENLQSNVRQLEGTVKKIKAKHELGGEAITIDMTQKVIEEVKSISPGLNPTPPMIIQTVSNFYSVPVDQIMSDRRSKDTVQPRQMAMYLVRKMTNYSLPEIGKVFGRDHTTVMHACDKIDSDRKKNAELEDIIKTLIENIQNL